MSHGILENDLMFSVREVPWHKKLTGDKTLVMDDYPGREAAMAAAGHDFQVIEENLFDGTGAQIGGWKLLRNNKTGKPIDISLDSFPVIPNEVLWDITDALATGKVDKAVRYETGGTLNNGAVLWVLSRLDEPIQVRGDNTLTYPFLNLSMAHDGTRKLRAFTTDVRTVCMNTFLAGLAKSEHQFAVRHTKNWKDYLEDMKEALFTTRKSFAEYKEMVEELGEMTTDYKGVQRFMEIFIPSPEADITSDRVKTNILNARAQLLDIIDNGKTIPDSHRRTGYGLWCAGIEYLDHYRKFRSQDSYFRRCVLDREPMKERLIEVVKEAVAA